MTEDQNKNNTQAQEQEDELAKCQTQREEYLKGWQRERADFLNYKRAEMERVGEIIKYGVQAMIIKFLPILDNFDLAEKKLSGDLKNSEEIKGLLQIRKQFADFLRGEGVEEIKTNNNNFNPNFQEVAEEIDNPDYKSGEIIEEVQKGYTLQGKLIRPAKVKIAK